MEVTGELLKRREIKTEVPTHDFVYWQLSSDVGNLVKDSHPGSAISIRAVESEFKSNPIFPIFRCYPIFYQILSGFYPIFPIFSDF